MTDTPTERENEGAWTKLRRRKAVQWGIAYAAGAWGLLQVLQFLADTYDWPAQVLRLATLAFAIGLPIALTLAWYHGDRGHQKPVRTELAIIALLLLLGGGALWLYGDRSAPAKTAATPATPTPAPTATGSKTSASVAVLPFANLSADPANEYLADGIAETMITMLAQVPQLLVIGKNSSFSYKGKDVDPRTIGQQLGVGALLEGSVQRAGDRLRVAVQLVNTRDGGHLWAETYDRPVSDVFAVQDDIAKRVTEALSVALAGRNGPGSIGTTNVAAYDAYLRAKQLVDRWESKSLVEAVALLERSVAADPNFARAWVELSRAYGLSAKVSDTGGVTPGQMPEEQANALSERAARHAVEAAPGLGAAHAALGSALLVRRDERKQAAEEFELAIALSPDDFAVVDPYAYFLTSMGRPKEAARLFEPLLAREPRDATIRTWYARSLDGSGDIPGALKQYREAIRLQPEFVRPYFVAGDTYTLIVGKTDLGLRLLRRATLLDPDQPTAVSILAERYRYLGEADLARQAEAELLRLGENKELIYQKAQAAAWDGRPRQAREIIEKALVEEQARYDWLWMLAMLPGTQDDHGATLRRIEEFLAQDPDWNEGGVFVDKTVCLNAWTGNEQVARDELARWESAWKSRHAFGYITPASRRNQLARSLACVGRNDDALTELEALLNEGYNIGWQDMAVDPAYDAIRGDPRFRAVSDKLKAADAAAKARFRARPDLNDSDIESLGSEPIGVKM